MGSRQKAVVKGMSKIAGEINVEMMKNDKVIRDQHRALFSEMVGKTGSQQSVLDRMLQEIQFLRDHEGGPRDEEVIDILRGKIAALERECDTAWAQSHRLALELECLLLDTKDNAVVSKWWDSGMEALSEYQELQPGAKEDAGAWAAMRKAVI